MLSSFIRNLSFALHSGGRFFFFFFFPYLGSTRIDPSVRLAGHLLRVEILPNYGFLDLTGALHLVDI